MRKQFAYALLAVALATGLFLFVKNQKITKDDAYYEAISHYVYAFTGGSISSTDPIRVRFVNAAVSKEQIGQTVDADVFSVKPSIAASIIWEDDRTILLKPDQPLPYGKKYTARVALGDIYTEVPSAAKVFEFDFNVRPLSFEVVTDGIDTDPELAGQQRIVGRVKVNEPCEAAKVKQMLSAKQGNKALLVSWKHSEDGRNHEWMISGVERTNVASQVDIQWAGAAIGVARAFKEVQPIPAADDFGVLSARAIQLEEQYILINFSDPVSPGQDLSGLIRIEGYEGKLRFVADGNFVRVYPADRITGDHQLVVDAAVQSKSGQRMKSNYKVNLGFEDLKPGVRLVGRGAIIPQQSNGGVIFPFEAVGLSAVDVEIFKIFNSNILQYLQVNEIEGDAELDRVGKVVLQKSISLADVNPNASSKTWQRYAIDLKDMIKQDPGAIYQVRLAFRRSYAAQTCTGIVAGDDKTALEKEDVTPGMMRSILGGERGIYWADNDPWWWGGGEEDGEDTNANPDQYRWNRREDPCAKEYYYYQHFVQRNVFVSDLGLTAKRGKDHSMFVAVTDLHTAQSVAGIDIQLFNYQLQPITLVKTNTDGTVLIEDLREIPFLVVAGDQNRRGYLRMADGNTLSLSRFDVAGVEAQQGMKGYIYGERGVWRPGDSLFLNFVLEDKTGKLPAGHPVVMELTDPRGAMQYRSVQTIGVEGVYPFYCATRAEAPTGNWLCTVKVGGATFTQSLKIETVKPNRLKMALDFGKTSLSVSDNNAKGNLKVNWLHGAVAKSLKAKVDMQIASKPTTFSNYKGYTFDDPSRHFYSEPEVLYDANLDQNGQAFVPLKFGQMDQAPGKLTANFKVRAFETGGDFSTDNFQMELSPFNSYVGVLIPANKWGSKSIDGRGANINFAMVNDQGKPLANKEVRVALYRVDWRWWWDEDQSSGRANFNSGEVNDALDQATLKTDARGQVQWKVQPSGWGRFLVRIEDPESGHASGDFFWNGYPDDQNDMQSRNAAAMLPFTADKDKYNVGDEVVLKVPASDNGRILLTLENGTRVARHLWFDAKAGDNLLRFKAEELMAPTIYAHVSLIQPHAQTKNDLPIRMYGVLPINVEDPRSRLQAQIDMPDVLKPDEFFNVSLRELGGKACVYTLDVVDEGLLDLTRFKTPNPWEAFYAREALGVKTWDIYDYVLGAYGVELERILGIGGDGINTKAKAAQINRFKPCVVHLGPFKLEKGQTAKHRLKISNYVGSVRVMAVLSDTPDKGAGGAYGNAEKTCPVRKPLMVLPTLPRVLGPGETLKLPVNVFAMEKSVQNAVISVREKSGLISVAGSGQNTLNFSEPGEKMAYFDLKVGQKSGAAKFVITAEGGGETATQEIELEVRNPNPLITVAAEATIEPGQSWSQAPNTGQFAEIAGAYVEISSIPPVNLSKQLDYLIQYPHGCVEQTISAAFPQLYVDAIAPLNDKQKAAIEKNIKAAIVKMQNFQNSTGGFSYWPGGNDVADWASTYAGHFLLEAKSKGFAVPQQMLDRWMENQTKASRSWNPQADDNGWYYHGVENTQAYRLFSLALAGKPDLANMNRLRELKNKYESTLSLLGAAYGAAGKKEVARDLMKESQRAFKYDWWGYTYGSNLRDMALRLETLVGIQDKKADDIAIQVATSLGNSNQWYSTQEVATCLRALSKFTKMNGVTDKPDFTLKVGDQDIRVNQTTPYYIHTFTESGSSKVSIKNNSKYKIYSRLILNGRPVQGDQTAESKNIALNIRYTDLKGQVMDVSKLTQGTDFLAEVTVTRTGDMRFDFNELALTQVFPSGWEILNTRMNLVGGSNSDPMDYQDVRDDRVMTYFDLPFNWNNSPNTKQSRIYRIQLNAAYAGRYYLPTVACEAMYDNRIRAAAPGKWVEVN